MVGSPGSAGTILTSSDGTSWTLRSVPQAAEQLYGISYGNSTFVAVGDKAGDPSPLYTSSDGTTWTSRGFAADEHGHNGVTYMESIFLIVGLRGTIYTSSDGTTWTSRTSNTSNNLYGVTSR